MFKKFLSVFLVLSLISVPLIHSNLVFAETQPSSTKEHNPFIFTSTSYNDTVILTFSYQEETESSEFVSLSLSENGKNNLVFKGVSKSKGEDIKIEGLSYDKQYIFDVKRIDGNSNNIINMFTGELTIRAKEGQEITSQVIITNVMSLYSSDRLGITAIRWEAEPNNTFGTADLTYDDDDNYGYISTTSDIDYWRISFPYSGNANFWLGSIPSGTDYDLYIYNSSQTLVASSTNSGNQSELISNFPVVANQTYYMKVVSWSGYSTSQAYYLRAKVYSDSGSPDQNEPNNSFSAATTIGNNSTINANIHNSSDQDYYKFTLTSRSNFTLSLSNIPSGTDYDVQLYNSSQTVIASSTNGGNSSEYISATLEAGTYFIRVYPYTGYSNSNYRLQITSTSVAPTKGQWYSQIEPTQSGSNSWDDTNLDKLFFPNMGSTSSARTPFEWNKWNQGNYSQIDPQAYDSGHMNMWGCVITSFAMVLKNLNATTTTQRYDFRTGTTSNQIADPFTVTLANIQYPSITSRNGRYEVTSYTSSDSPVYTYPSRIGDAFGYNVYEVSLLGKTDAQKAEILTNYLNDHPEGIIVRISDVANPTSRSQGVHSLVFNKSTYQISGTSSVQELEEGVLVTEDFYEMDLESFKYAEKVIEAKMLGLDDSSIMATSPHDNKFTVTDPGTQQAAKGDNVLFSDSWSRSQYGGLQHLVYLQYLVRK